MIRNVLLVCVLALLVSMVMLNITSCAVSSSLKSLQQEQEARRADEWRELIVHDIVARQGPDPMAKGMTVAEIKKEYPGEAAKWAAGPSKNEISDEELNKALHNLFKTGSINKTTAGGFTKFPTFSLPDVPFPPPPEKK